MGSNAEKYIFPVTKVVIYSPARIYCSSPEDEPQRGTEKVVEIEGEGEW